MARPTWSGFISFGLVNVGVKLFTVVRSHDIHFKQLHEGTNARVRRKRVDEETGEEVPYDEIVKGYETDDGRYVIVDPDELEQLDPEASRMIDIRDFVDLSDIDPIYYDRPYYLVPDDEAAVKPYALLVEAMQQEEKVAIAKFVMRNNEYLAAIRPKDGMLVLSTMHYADEVADPDHLDAPELSEVDVDDREVDMARQLIGQLVTDFDPTEYEDEHKQRVVEFLEAKAAGERVEVPEPAEEPGGVVDLMAALEESIRSAGRGRASGDGDGRGGNGRYEEMTKADLYEIAQERDLPGRSDMTKDELVDALEEAS